MLLTPKPRLRSVRIFLILVVGLGWGGASLGARTINGFNVDQTTIPAEHIVRAAPAKDSIQSLDRTQWVTSEESGWLADDDEILSLTLDGETRAYPLRILVWHEVVNDTVGEHAVVLTYSALSGSALVFDPGVNADGSRRSFGVSGLLYNSCLLMYNRSDSTLWSQLKMRGVSGDAQDVELKPIAARTMRWGAWKVAFPKGKVLSKDTGLEGDYTGDWPYGDYATQRATIFPFDINRDEFGTKEVMVGLCDGESARSWPIAKLRTKKQLYDAIGPRAIALSYDATTDGVLITDISTGEVLPSFEVFWFAWQAFYPDTSVWIPLR